MKVVPAPYQVPTIEDTFQYIESASRSDQITLRTNVALRERYYCAITGLYDRTHANKLTKEGRIGEVPRRSGQSNMEAAHIIPLFLNHFDDASNSQAITDAARTWDMFCSWTQVDVTTLTGSNINSPTNAIYMTVQEHKAFGSFHFYLDKEAHPDIPNKYRVCMFRENSDILPLSIGLGGVNSVDVEFRTLPGGTPHLFVGAPNPNYLKVHAGAAKVLDCCRP